jgi:ABC-2 type transport system permease protein
MMIPCIVATVAPPAHLPTMIAPRRTVFAHAHAPASVSRSLDPGITWFGWHLPLLFELGVVVVVAAALLGGAIAQFTRTE